MITHKDGTIPPYNDYVWVFGSNYAGIHGAGAALIARNRYGRPDGTPTGMYTRIMNDFLFSSYAIPTKNANFDVLSVPEITLHVDEFARYTLNHPGMKFWITRIGCGLAGYADFQIAPLFKNVNFENCSFPEQWEQYVK